MVSSLRLAHETDCVCVFFQIWNGERWQEMTASFITEVEPLGLGKEKGTPGKLTAHWDFIFWTIGRSLCLHQRERESEFSIQLKFICVTSSWLAWRFLFLGFFRWYEWGSGEWLSNRYVSSPCCFPLHSLPLLLKRAALSAADPNTWLHQKSLPAH